MLLAGVIVGIVDYHFHLSAFVIAYVALDRTAFSV
jgi:hypothetical protein